MEIQYRKLSLKDIPQLREMVNAQYARKKNDAYFKWQFFSSHYPTVCMGAFDDNKLIGMFGLQKRELADSRSAGHLIDLLVHPDYRGKDIFSEMGKKTFAVFTDVKFFTILPNPNGRAACEKAFGFKTLAKIDDLVLRNPDRVNLNVKASFGNQKVLAEYQKNNKYQAWRYKQSPIYSYDRINVGKRMNFAYLKKFIDPFTKESYLDIVDYNSGSTTNQKSAFWKNLLGKLAKTKERNISTWALPHTSDFAILTIIGFEKLPRDRYFCVLNRDTSFNSLSKITAWHLVPADAEIY